MAHDTNPAKSHRVTIKTPGGPLMTRALSEQEAMTLASDIRRSCASTAPVIILPLTEGNWEFNTGHATAWRVVENKLTNIP